MLPPWPGMDGLHPLVIHFPVALLLTAPLFVVLAMIRPATNGFGVSALRAAGARERRRRSSRSNPASLRRSWPRGPRSINAAIAAHASLAETARNVFVALTLIYAVILAVPRLVKRFATRSWVLGTHLLFLGLLIAGCLVLANAAHRGGVLVHRHGVQAFLPPEK